MSVHLGEISHMTTGPHHDDAPFQRFISTLVCICTALKLNLHDAIQGKLEINNRKYPPHLCKGKPASIKYTEYSKHTGITKVAGQSIMVCPTDKGSPLLRHHGVENVDFLRNIPTLERTLLEFVKAREWDCDDIPRNLLFATIGEFGELSQLFAWKGDNGYVVLNDDELDKVAQEAADVAILFIRLAFRLDVDLTVPS